MIGLVINLSAIMSNAHRMFVIVSLATAFSHVSDPLTCGFFFFVEQYGKSDESERRTEEYDTLASPYSHTHM